MGDRIRDKTAIVTGAGSVGPGIGNGKAAAMLFAREGARVMLVDYNLDAAEETRRLIEGEGGTCFTAQADVSNAADCNRIAQECVSEYGRIDILHNNVGIEIPGGILEITEDDWDLYVVYPLIEESEKADYKSAVEAYDELRHGPLAEFTVALLHGRMAAEEKAAVMEDFKQNRIQVLVCTTVVEVGVDVPNATVMIIEHTERFGLAQLHQLRGRVGRGGEQSFCILISYAHAGAELADSRERLKTMERTQDGFEIAEKDLQLRGPGEFFGGAPGRDAHI